MYQHILVAVDGSVPSKAALKAAIQLAVDNHAKLTALYVVDNTPVLYDAGYYDPSILRNSLIEEGDRVVADAARDMQVAGLKPETRVVEVELLGDDISHQIEQAALAAQADIVVLGTHGRRGFRRLMLGSVAERFVRVSTLPVLLIPSHQPEPVPAN